MGILKQKNQNTKWVCSNSSKALSNPTKYQESQKISFQNIYRKYTTANMIRFLKAFSTASVMQNVDNFHEQISKMPINLKSMSSLLI